MKFKRNPYLDFYRSIAVISIIFIHTVFHSGERYVPHIFQTLALLIDVPFFMYLTGWSAIYNSSLAKAFLRIFRIISQWIFFVIFVNGVLLIFNYRDFNNFQDLFKAFLFMAYPDTLLPSIAWSIWYMPVYFKVLVIGNLLLCLVDFSN